MGETSQRARIRMEGGGRQMGDEVVVEMASLFEISPSRSRLRACLADESR